MASSAAARINSEDRTTEPDEALAVRGVTIEDAIRHTGGFGRWQLKALFAFQLAISSGSIILYSMSYLELQPKYECRNLGSG